MNVDLGFRNYEQEQYFWHKERNGEFDGGFGNGKTYVGCERAFVHLTTFSSYGMAICRQEYKQLRTTTMKTFFKICPKELIYRHDEQYGYTVLINKSFIYWMHLDDYDEDDLRGLEINSVLIDQAEGILEAIYEVLDARVGRWDKAIVPLWLLRSKLETEAQEELVKIYDEKEQEVFIKKYTKWPRHKKWGHFLVPNYMDVLCNVADDDEFHWTYRYYHRDSFEKKPDHFYIHRESDADLNDERTFSQMLMRDSEWVDKYIKGLRGKNKAAIHSVPEICIIDPDKYTKEEFEELLHKIYEVAILFRTLDHGDTGVTCCGWDAVLNKIQIFYREYYVGSTLISVNRQNIYDLSFHDPLSGNGEKVLEEYYSDYADPKIFSKDRQKQAIGVKQSQFWTVAKEYSETDIIDAPPIYWRPADNNEMATRNRINELLVLSPRNQHPITKLSPAPGIYWIKKTASYPFGCQELILQTKNQRRTLLGSDNGKNLYSEERDESKVDHAYDVVRYAVATHNMGTKTEIKQKPKRMSFEYYNQMLKKRPGFVPASQRR